MAKNTFSLVNLTNFFILISLSLLASSVYKFIILSELNKVNNRTTDILSAINSQRENLDEILPELPA